ncbi:MAG: transcriptional regulator GcvA [Burkholderiales bacterium]|nr:transcriptional regulator GcvA [Burkholderiales bacterium]
MRKDLPSLALLPGFEAAARHLSFTRAAAELFLTQSAVSRQIKSLEDELGVALFVRRNRALALTPEGEALLRATHDVLARLRDTTAGLRARHDTRALTVSTTVSFASLWLVPRLQRWRALRPAIDVHIAANDRYVDLERDRIDLAVRFCEPQAAPEGAIRLAEEVVFPVCSPRLLRNKRRPLKRPEDLAHHVLLHYEDAGRRWPWLDWGQWLAAARLPQLKTAGGLHFSHYDQLIRAALAGDGVALGRTPHLTASLKSGELVAPFARRTASGRQYFLIVARHAAARPEVQSLVQWMLDEAGSD